MIINDSLIYCYDCGADKTNGCKRHKLNWVLNKSINCTFTRLKSSPMFKKYQAKSGPIMCTCNRSNIKHIENTLPDCLLFKISSLNKNEVGVWTLDLIPRGTMFGPFLGKVMIIENVKTDVYESSINGRAWLIHKNEESKNDIIVNARNPFLSNWMRYVSCDVDPKKQNLLATQYDGMIFYRACEHEMDLEILKGRKLKRSKHIFAINSDIDDDQNSTNLRDKKMSKVQIATHHPRFTQYNNIPKICRPIRFFPPLSFMRPFHRRIQNVSLNPLNQQSLLPLIRANHQPQSKKLQINTMPVSETIDKNQSSVATTNKRLGEAIVSKSHSSCPKQLKIETTSIMQMAQLLKSFSKSKEDIFPSNKDIKVGSKKESIEQNEAPCSPKLLYKNVDHSVNEPHFKCSLLDDQSVSYISHILKFEPYLSIENIIIWLKEKFPTKLGWKRSEILSLLQSEKIREQSSLWINVDEDIISGVVDLFRKNPRWTFEMIASEVLKMFPIYPTASVNTVENIVRSNFSERKINSIEKDVIQFIYRVIKQKPEIKMTEINVILREKFPDRKIISNIVIDGILKKSGRRQLTSDTINNQVKKMVKEIHKEWNLHSKFK